MKKALLTVCLAFLLVGLAERSVAQTSYDVANYFQLTAGKWFIEENRPLDNPQAPVEKLASVVTVQGQYILHNEFELKGQVWTPTGIQVFELTKTHLLYYGGYNPANGDYELFNPPLKLPRSLMVGDPVVYKGLLVTPQGAKPATVKLVITGDKISKKVKAGTYTDCIRLKGSIITDDIIDSFSEIRAPGHGLVYGVDSFLDETETEPNIHSNCIYQRTDPKKP